MKTTSEQLRELRETPLLLGKLLTQWRTGMRKLDGLDPEYYTQKYREMKKAEAHQQHLDVLILAREDAQKTRDALLADARKAAKGPKLTPEVEAARAMSEGRTWGRLERLLTAGYSPDELIKTASDEKDIVALRVLRQELPSFLKAAQGADTTGRKIGAAQVDVALSQIDTAIHPLLPASEREAIELQEEVSRGWQNVELALNLTSYEMEDPRAWQSKTTTLLPAWEKGEVVPVSGE